MIGKNSNKFKNIGGTLDPLVYKPVTQLGAHMRQAGDVFTASNAT